MRRTDAKVPRYFNVASAFYLAGSSLKSGHKLDLLVAAIVLLLLLAASYSGRRGWITLGSTALSAVLIAGWVFLTTAQYAGPFLGTLAERLPITWAQRAQELGKAAERVSASLASSRKRVAVQASSQVSGPVSAASISQGFGAEWLSSQSIGTQELELRPEIRPKLGQEHRPEQPPQAETTKTPQDGRLPVTLAPDAPVKWILDEPPSGKSPGVVLTGANVSNDPLEDIRATLKPDVEQSGSGSNAMTLRLLIDGQDGEPRQGAAIVPPGARFHLQAPSLSDGEAGPLGGAIVSFAYVQAGRHRTSIMYLTQTALAGRTAP